MCLNKKEIYNPSRFISVSHFPRMIVYGNCGYCEQCQEINRYEWQIRAYYEAKRAAANGQYLYFDCLTYKNIYIPTVHDHLPWNSYSCFDGHFSFSKDHIRKFFVRLRRQLAYHYDVSLRYFVGAEYGVDPYKTMRSHYHILLYVNDEIKPSVISKLVAKCWKYGRTDGLPYKSLTYVKNHNVISGWSDSSIKASKYVAKYVMKPYELSREIVQCVRNCFQVKYNGNAWMENSSLYKQYLSVLRQSLPFHYS